MEFKRSQMPSWRSFVEKGRKWVDDNMDPDDYSYSTLHRTLLNTFFVLVVVLAMGVILGSGVTLVLFIAWLSKISVALSVIVAILVGASLIGFLVTVMD